MAAEPALSQPIVVDTQVEDDSSDYGSATSSTSSLRSSIFQHVYENGRRYHSYRTGQYWLPNDDEEQDRLDYSHHLFTMTLQGALCASKLVNPQSILDVGTGTGIWAINMGDLYPSATVIGTDLSPIQPEWVPPNVRFEIDDATEDWTFPENHFDFIHARALSAGVRDWPKFVAQCFRHVKPGGQVEIAEGRVDAFCDDDSFPADSYTRRWLNEFHRICGEAHINFDPLPQVPQMMRDAGFTDVATLDNPVPYGPWAKDPGLKAIGRVMREQFLTSALEGYTVALFTRLGGWSYEEFQVLAAHVRQEVATNKMHLYTFCSFVTARKPGGDEKRQDTAS